jgi:mannose-6-phosphate isomerase-like protein (cupin superfamily)
VGKRILFPLISLLICGIAAAQESSVAPTWLHRSLLSLRETRADLSSPSCHYKPIFGVGDPDGKFLQSVSRFGELTVDPHGSCETVVYDREEETDFVLEGTGALQAGSDTHALRKNDFTYLAPATKHSFANNSADTLRIFIMGFKIPARQALDTTPSAPRIVNLDQLKSETVQGHPSSVLYKLLVGPRKAKRDAIDEAYVVTSLFWMDFAPGGTNLPHHHESAEEIYIVIQGEGEMVAGGGMDGIEGRHPAKAGDVFYFRPNCTVGFYNQNKPGAKAYILAVRSRIPLSDEED